MQPFEHSRFEWPAVLACLAAFVIAVMALTSCHLDTQVIGHRIDQAPVLVVTPSKPDDDAGLEQRTESTYCSVLQMQSWVTANYPSSYGWTRSFSGNNGRADLVTGWCPSGFNAYDEKRFNAGSCSAGSCTYDVQDCALGCTGQSCGHSYTLKCTCAPNQCQVLP